MSIIYEIANALHRKLYRNDPGLPLTTCVEEVREVIWAIEAAGFKLVRDEQHTRVPLIDLCGTRWSNSDGHHSCGHTRGHSGLHLCRGCEARRW